MISLLTKKIQAQESTLRLPEQTLLQRLSLGSSPHSFSIFFNSYCTLLSNTQVSPPRRLQLNFDWGIHGLQGQDWKEQHKRTKRQGRSCNTLWSPWSAACQQWTQAECKCTPADMYSQCLSSLQLALPCQLSSYLGKIFHIPRPSGSSGVREGRGCCQDEEAERFCKKLIQLRHNDCLTVPTMSQGKLGHRLIRAITWHTSHCACLIDKLAWYSPTHILRTQQQIDSWWISKILDRVEWETETHMHVHMQ